MGNGAKAIRLDVAAFEAKKDEMQAILDEIAGIRESLKALPFPACTSVSKGPTAAKAKYLTSCLSLTLHEMGRMVEKSMEHLETISVDFQTTDAQNAAAIGSE